MFRFTLRRKWLFQVLNMLAPIVCISFLNLTCFLIPSESGEKITLCISIFLSLAVFLTVTTSTLPESSDETCLFGLYVGLQLFGSGLTILATVISLRLYHKEKETPVPMLFRVLANICCCSNPWNKIKPLSPPNGKADTVDKESEKPKIAWLSNSHVSWVCVSRAFDQLCLCLSVIWNLCLIIGFAIAFQE